MENTASEKSFASVKWQKSIIFDLPRLLLKSPTGLLGFILIATMVIVAIFAPIIAPFDPTKIDLYNTAAAPGVGGHILGTDVLGRDMLSRIIYGSRVSLIVGVCSVIIAGFIGTSLGLIAGFYGGWIDSVIMRLSDALFAIPLTLSSIVMLGILGAGVSTLILVIGVTTWTMYARMIRSQVLSIKEREYVKAAKTIGTSEFTIIIKHILPNVMSSFIVTSTLSVASCILTEASLSFLGLGIQPPTISWGIMLSDGRNYLATSWWIATFPGVAISLTVLGIMLFGNWLRDVLDPRSQGIK